MRGLWQEVKGMGIRLDGGRCGRGKGVGWEAGRVRGVDTRTRRKRSHLKGNRKMLMLQAVSLAMAAVPTTSVVAAAAKLRLLPPHPRQAQRGSQQTAGQAVRRMGGREEYRRTLETVERR